MKKKLLSLFLCSSMLLGMLAGCGKKDDEEGVADVEESERVAMTLSLWLPTDEGTTAEAIKLTEAALNKLTQSKYETAIELHAISRDEYQQTIDAKIAEVEKNIEAEEEAARARRQAAKDKAAGKQTKETEAPETVIADETYVDEIGVTRVKYPSVASTQMDIFLVQGYDNYQKYIENDQIQRLDAELNATSKLLNSYVYEQFFELLKPQGIYAIPNNHPVGEYQYLLFNKELMDTYDYTFDPAKFNSIRGASTKEFIEDMAWLKENGEAALQDVTLILGSSDLPGMNYWSIDGEWSLIGSQIKNLSTNKSKSEPKVMLRESAYWGTIYDMKTWAEKGWLGDGIVDEGEKFAVGILSGDGSLVEKYGDEYYMHVLQQPMMTQEDLYGSMFAVSSYTKSLERSMEIITYLNTDPEVRTILQYGAEGVHWEYDTENPDVIKILSNDYSMRLVETGNVYMTYPGEGIPMSYWNYGKQQNLDSMVSPYLTFGTSYITEENKAKLEALAKLSAEYQERISKMSAEEFNSQKSTIQKELEDNELLKELLDKKEITYSLAFIYKEFCSSNGIE